MSHIFSIDSFKALISSGFETSQGYTKSALPNSAAIGSTLFFKESFKYVNAICTPWAIQAFAIP